MANKFRNEMEVKLGAELILLRPTFENVANTEAALGGMPYLVFKYGRGVKLDENQKVIKDSLRSEEAMKAVPGFSDTAQIIFHNQAEKKFSLEEIYEKVLAEGIGCCFRAKVFISLLSAGDSTVRDDVAPSEKKN